MPGRNATIAAAVVAALNAAAGANQFAQTFTAVRRWVPVVDLGKLPAGLNVVAYSTGDERTRDNRGYDRYEPVVDVGLIQRLTPRADPESLKPADVAQVSQECDAHLQLAESVCAFFKPRAVVVDDAEFFKATILNPLIDPSALLAQRTLVSIVSVTFQAYAKNP